MSWMSWCQVFAVLSCLSLATSTTLPTLHRELEGAGLHRTIKSTLTFPPEVTEQLSRPDIRCQVLLTETIPSGAYVDPFQLASLKDFGGPDALVLDKVDIEQPEQVSDPHTVLVYIPLGGESPLVLVNHTLPVHLRYHALSSTDRYVNVQFPQPEAAVKCFNTDVNMQEYVYSGETLKMEQAPCDSTNQLLCDWTYITYTAVTDPLTAQVPVGNSAHFLPVVIGTTLVTVAGCLLVLCQVLYQPGSPKGKAHTGKYK